MPDTADWRDAAPTALVTAVDAAFPERTVTDVTGTGPSWNDQNVTAEVAFADDTAAFLKAALDGDGTRVARERAVTDYLRDRSRVAVPDVLAAAPDGDPPYLATAPLGDHSLRVDWRDADDAARERLAERAGSALAAVHDRDFDHHGHVVGGGADGLDVDTGACTDVLVDRIEFGRSVAPVDRFEHYYEAVADAVRANRDALDGAPAALVHGDPAAPNAFALPDRFGFVDWELAHVGDPARDRQRAIDQLFADRAGDAPSRYVDAFDRGYRDHADTLPEITPVRAAVYDAIRYLGRVGFFENYAEFADEPRDALAETFETEMERRLDAIR